MSAAEPFDQGDNLPVRRPVQRGAPSLLNQGWDPDERDWEEGSQIALIIESFSCAMTQRQAAEVSHINKNRITEWLKRGEILEPNVDGDESEVLADYTTQELQYLWFRRRAVAARSGTVLECARTFRKAAMANPDMAVKFLERVDPQNWATTNNHVVRSADTEAAELSAPLTVRELLATAEARDLVDQMERAIAAQRAEARGMPAGFRSEDIIDAEIIED